MSHNCSPLASTFKWAVLILLAALSLFSCKDDDKPNNTTSLAADQTAPVVTIALPTNESQVPAGASFSIRGAVNDNRELSQVKITMHNAFDGHTHRTTEAVPFELTEVIPVTGMVAQLNKAINLPADAASGPYHIMIQALDKAGNSSKMVEIDVEVVNSKQTRIPSFSTRTGGNNPSSIVISLDGNDTKQEEFTLMVNSPTTVTHAKFLFYEISKDTNAVEPEKLVKESKFDVGKHDVSTGTLTFNLTFEKSKFKPNTEYEAKVIVENKDLYQTFRDLTTFTVVH
jgi:copper(I)-binding protein